MKHYVLYKKVKNYYNVAPWYYFFVLEVEEGEKSILYSYSSMKGSDEVPKSTDLLKPTDMQFTDAKDVDELNNLQSNYNKDVSYVLISEDPADYNLYIPKKSKSIDDFKVIEVRDPEITDKMLEKVKTYLKKNYKVIIGEDYSLADDRSDSIFKYYCLKCESVYTTKKGENKSSYRYGMCPKCNSSWSDEIVSKDLKEFRKKEFAEYASWGVTFDKTTNAKKNSVFYVAKHPENEAGIIIYKISKEISVDKGVLKNSFTIDYKIEHIVGGKTVCIKKLKKGEKECDTFEALNINTKNLNYLGLVLYEDAPSFLEFALRNEKFLKMCGFQDVLKYGQDLYGMESFFMLYIALVNKYPILEQIIKMGHAKIFFGLYDKILNCTNKEEINNHVAKISNIVDNEAVKGKEALRIPIFIGDYLIRKNADFDEYYYWRDIYEITRFTKEQFENLINSFNYAWVNSQASLHDVGNILKFGYSTEKLFNYIVKQQRVLNNSIESIVTYMTDYLNMCDILQVEPDMFPQNIVKVHNDLLAKFKERKKMEYDKKLNVIGTQCEEYVIPSQDELDNVGIPKLFKEYTIVFPKSEVDFINEGNMQHNCVGSYPNRVRNGNCVIFFIRKKSDPKHSFITAECTKSGLGQCMYSNNRTVTDDDLKKFASYICSKIKTGVSSGKIKALGNA